jgi:hypothetical protein
VSYGWGSLVRKQVCTYHKDDERVSLWVGLEGDNVSQKVRAALWTNVWRVFDSCEITVGSHFVHISEGCWVFFVFFF